MTAFERIVTNLVPAWIDGFRRKSDDYNSTEEFGGMEPHTVLGVRGQFADIWRKVWKLKKALWDGVELKGEQPEEIIQDLIAHLFLTLDLIKGIKPEPEEILLVPAEPVREYLATSLPLQVIEFGRLAVSGDPSWLEGVGYLLLDRNPGADALDTDRCSGGHQFDKSCAYRIARRRIDG